MDLPTTNQEKDPLEDTNEDVLKLNFYVKVEENQQDLDWCLQNPDSVETKQNFSQSVSYDDLKEYCYQKCFLCFQLFPDNYSLVQHNLNHIIIPLHVPHLYQCDYCLVYFTTKTELISHMRTKHEHEAFGVPRLSALHQCKICLKSFKYKYWHAHMNNVHSSEKVECQKCNMFFKCKRNLERHILYVHKGICKPINKKPVPGEPSVEIICGQCPKVFKSKDCLNHHIQNCHGESVECNICKSRLKSKAYLNTHMRRVHYNDGKVHKCPICAKTFRSPRYVNVHVKNVHTNRGNKSETKSGECGKTGDEISHVYLQEYHSVTIALREELPLLAIKEEQT